MKNAAGDRLGPTLEYSEEEWRVGRACRRPDNTYSFCCGKLIKDGKRRSDWRSCNVYFCIDNNMSSTRPRSIWIFWKSSCCILTWARSDILLGCVEYLRQRTLTFAFSHTASPKKFRKRSRFKCMSERYRPSKWPIPNTLSNYAASRFKLFTRGFIFTFKANKPIPVITVLSYKYTNKIKKISVLIICNLLICFKASTTVPPFVWKWTVKVRANQAIQPPLQRIWSHDTFRPQKMLVYSELWPVDHTLTLTVLCLWNHNILLRPKALGHISAQAP